MKQRIRKREESFIEEYFVQLPATTYVDVWFDRLRKLITEGLMAPRQGIYPLASILMSKVYSHETVTPHHTKVIYLCT